MTGVWLAVTIVVVAWTIAFVVAIALCVAVGKDDD